MERSNSIIWCGLKACMACVIVLPGMAWLVGAAGLVVGQAWWPCIVGSNMLVHCSWRTNEWVFLSGRLVRYEKHR